MRLADGVLLAVDAVEGVLVVTERAIRQAAADNLPICLLITKASDPERARLPICVAAVT
jgi:U5 small nuclear ribonucleoprotein component